MTLFDFLMGTCLRISIEHLSWFYTYLTSLLAKLGVSLAFCNWQWFVEGGVGYS